MSVIDPHWSTLLEIKAAQSNLSLSAPTENVPSPTTFEKEGAKEKESKCPLSFLVGWDMGERESV